MHNHSSFLKRAEVLWSSVKWTGGSHIHASLQHYSHFPVSTREALKKAYDTDLPGRAFLFYQKQFPGLEWIITKEDFQNLFYSDLYRRLKGGGDTQHPSKLKNPSTGNVFHRMAVAPGIMGGARFWFDKVGDGTYICVRFRLERANEEQSNTRQKAAEVAALAKEEMLEVLSFVEFQEPVKQGEKVEQVESQPLKEIL